MRFLRAPWSMPLGARNRPIQPSRADLPVCLSSISANPYRFGIECPPCGYQSASNLASNLACGVQRGRSSFFAQALCTDLMKWLAFRKSDADWR